MAIDVGNVQGGVLLAAKKFLVWTLDRRSGGYDLKGLAWIFQSERNNKNRKRILMQCFSIGYVTLGYSGI